MQKSELREAGYAEQEKYQKKSVITAIWVVSALAMIAFVFVFMVLVTIWKRSGGEFTDFMDDVANVFSQIFRQWKAAVYLLLWALMLLTLFFITRRELREQRLSALDAPKPKRMSTYMLRSALVLLALAAAFYFLALLAEIPEQRMRGGSGGGDVDLFELVSAALSLLGPLSIFVYLVVWELLYLAVKLVATRLVCLDKKNGIKLKILKGTSMPVCSCDEALSLRHVLVAHLTPLVFMYSMLLLLCATADGDTQLAYHTITAMFMSFFMSYDLTLVLYSAYLKIRHKPDYISINHHIYEVTLFKKSYVTNPAAKRRSVAKSAKSEVG